MLLVEFGSIIYCNTLVVLHFLPKLLARMAWFFSSVTILSSLFLCPPPLLYFPFFSSRFVLQCPSFKVLLEQKFVCSHMFGNITPICIQLRWSVCYLALSVSMSSFTTFSFLFVFSFLFFPSSSFGALKFIDFASIVAGWITVRPATTDAWGQFAADLLQCIDDDYDANQLPLLAGKICRSVARYRDWLLCNVQLDRFAQSTRSNFVSANTLATEPSLLELLIGCSVLLLTTNRWCFSCGSETWQLSNGLWNMHGKW